MATTKQKPKRKSARVRRYRHHDDAPDYVVAEQRAWNRDRERAEEIYRVARECVSSGRIEHVDKNRQDLVDAAIAQAICFVDTIAIRVPQPNYEEASPIQRWREAEAAAAKSKARETKKRPPRKVTKARTGKKAKAAIAAIA